MTSAARAWAEMDEARAGVPALMPTPGEPLDRSAPLRLALEWEGERWVAHDPASGRIVEAGEVEPCRARDEATWPRT